MLRTERVNVRVGDFVSLTMPHSEVCIHMQIAGKRMYAHVIAPNAVQLYDITTGLPFSAPITSGEAGFYSDKDGLYFHPNPDLHERVLDSDLSGTAYISPAISYAKSRGWEVQHGINWTWAAGIKTLYEAQAFVKYLESQDYEHRGIYPPEGAGSYAVRFRR